MAVDRVSWRSKSVLASLSVRRSGTGAYAGFRSIKRRGVFLLPPGWELIHHTPPAFNSEAGLVAADSVLSTSVLTPLAIRRKRTDDDKQ